MTFFKGLCGFKRAFRISKSFSEREIRRVFGRLLEIFNDFFFGVFKILHCAHLSALCTIFGVHLSTFLLVANTLSLPKLSGNCTLH